MHSACALGTNGQALPRTAQHAQETAGQNHEGDVFFDNAMTCVAPPTACLTPKTEGHTLATNAQGLA